MNLTFIILGCLVPGLMTGIGAIPIFFAKDVSQKVLDVLLAAAAGVMLAATCFSLIIPSLEVGEGRLGVLVTGLGIFCGALMLDLIDRYAPHEHLIEKKHEGMDVKNLSKIWLFVIAIAIHNFPEGLAVALALVREGYSRKKGFAIATLTGLVEPIGAFLGVWLVSIFSSTLGFILALAGGAMLFVISDEIIPETHNNGYERAATYGVIFGFILMMFLDALI